MDELLILVDELPSDLKIPKFCDVIEGRNNCATVIAESASENDDPLVVLIDGLPGSGKSGLTQKISDLVQESVVIALDDFIGTERGSRERMALTESSENFRNGYIRYPKAQDFLTQVVTNLQNGRTDTLTIIDAYQRNLGGKFADKQFNMPDASKVLVVEGTGAINNISVPAGVQCISVYVYARIKEALLNGTLRDIKIRGGDGDFVEIYTARLREYMFILEEYERTISSADIVCRRYTEHSDFKDKLDSDRARNFDILKNIPPKVLDAISPKGTNLKKWVKNNS